MQGSSDFVQVVGVDLVITNILRDQCTRKYHLWALWVELEPACDSAEAHRPTHILVA